MTRDRPMFICFTGTDGTGKTTLAKRFAGSSGEDTRFRYVYGRLSPVLSKPFILFGNWLFLRKKDIHADYQGYKSSKTGAVRKHRALYGLYTLIVLVDYALQIQVKVRLPLLLKRNIVCDRYIYDTVLTDISVDQSYTKEQALSLLKRIDGFFPAPDHVFLVDVPEEIAFKRKTDVPSIQYLKDRRILYQEVGEQYGMIRLDGTMGIDEIIGAVRERVFGKGAGDENR